jgi:hypothetical protein
MHVNKILDEKIEIIEPMACIPLPSELEWPRRISNGTISGFWLRSE